jgi:PAS domain S-box-containing protein
VNGAPLGRRSFLLLSSITILIVVTVAGIAIGLLYAAGIAAERQRLAEIVDIQTSVLASLARAADAGGGANGGEAGRRAVIAHVVGAADAFHRLGDSGELMIAGVDASGVHYLIPSRHTPAGTASLQDFQPMLRALAGETGSAVVTDHRGATVLTAFAPAPALGLGFVAKIDRAEIIAPYLRAGAIAAASAVVLIGLGSLLFFAITDPIVRRIAQAEARFRELFHSMGSGGLICEPVDDGGICVLRDINRAAERIDGVLRDTVLGCRLGTAMPGVARSAMGEAMERVGTSGVAEQVPPHTVEQGGVTSWRQGHVYRLSSGETVAVYDDLTEHKKAELTLRDSEARWRSIIELQNDAMIVVDKDNRIRFANRAAEIMFGKPTEQLKGIVFGYPVVVGDIAEIEIIQPNRRIAYAEMQAIPMRWDGEDHFLLFLRDVSAHRRAEGDLRKLFSAIEQSPASVMITDVQGNIEYVNPKFTETSGFTYPEVVGKNPRVLRSGKVDPEVYQDLWQTIGAGSVWRGELLNKKKSGELFWEQASVAPVRDARGKITHYVSVKEDITERKATEERLRLAQKMNALGELTGGIAHDFNNLLAIILGNLQLLDEMCDDDAEKHELIADAVWSAERGAELTNRLLAFARRQHLHPAITDVTRVIREMTVLLRRTLGERIDIREELARDVHKTMVDPGQLQNAVLNLVVNARDAMPNGGVLTITTENAAVEPGSDDTHHGVQPGDYVVITVGDTGMGMPADVTDRIFEPFFTTKKFGKGSGLGLSMVYGFVSQSGGQVTVDSRIGRGTRIRLFLPKATAAEVEAPRVERPPPPRSDGGHVILVVEDEDRVRKTAVRVLQKQGYHIVEAGSAGEALERVAKLARLDLLFTDVVLSKGMNGPDLAREIHRRWPDVRVLFTSGYAQNPLIGSGLPSGHHDMLPKPYRREDLTNKVRAMLAAERDSPG